MHLDVYILDNIRLKQQLPVKRFAKYYVAPFLFVSNLMNH